MALKIKIGKRIYDSEKQPVMLIFDNDEVRELVARQIANMPPKDGIRKYAAFPVGIPPEQVAEFMQVPLSTAKENTTITIYKVKNDDETTGI